MNFDYKILSDPKLSLDFIEENLYKFSQAELNLLCIFNKNITPEFIQKYPLYPWAYYKFQENLIYTKSIAPIDYDELKKKNVQGLYDKFGKFETNTSKEEKHKHIKIFKKNI